MRGKPASGTCPSLPSALASVGRFLPADDVGRLGEQVVAQVHDHELGRERLAGVPGRALRLAAAALGARREVEVALPGEVLDLPLAEDGVLGQVLHVGEVDRVALVVGDGQQLAQPVRLALGQHVERGRRDVQVLAVDDQDGEPEDDAHLRQQEERLQALVVGAVAEQLRHRPRRERRVGRAEREVAGVVLRAAVEQQRDDDQRDHAEHCPRRAGVRAVEPAVALLAVRGVAQPVDREPDDREQHRHGEEVLEEAQPAGVPEEREREVLADHQRAHRLDDRRAEDHEAPEGEEVRDARAAPAQQAALAEDLLDLVAQPLLDVVGAPLRRPAGADQLDQPGDAPPGDRHGDQQHRQGEHDPQGARCRVLPVEHLPVCDGVRAHAQRDLLTGRCRRCDVRAYSQLLAGNQSDAFLWPP